MPFISNQRIILITGTSSGFGLLAAARLSAQGHCVYATMRDLSKQKDLVDEVRKRGGQVLVRELDVTKPATITKVLDEIKAQHGGLDVVINNAGFGLGGFFEDLAEEDIRWQMEVNFFGVQNVCRQILPFMREKRGGLIMNISSIAGRTATPFLGAYNASKWALEGFSESLYYEVAPFNIKVVLLEPGAYRTKIFTDNARYGKHTDNSNSPYYGFSQRIKEFVKQTSAHSHRDPEHVAKLIERIVMTPNPKLRYLSDWISRIRVMLSNIIPPSLYNLIFQRIIYGNSNRPV